MYYLRTLGARDPLSPVSLADVEFLREQLESLAEGASSFYVDQPTVEMLYTMGATAELLAALTDAVRDSGEAELEIVEARLASVDEPPSDEPPSDADAAIERAFAEEPDVSGPTRMINGLPLSCTVCGEKSFTRRSAQLHSATATFFGFEWTGPSADCYICASCGYVHWFMN